jgi:hypothetical protein
VLTVGDVSRYLCPAGPGDSGGNSGSGGSSSSSGGGGGNSGSNGGGCSGGGHDDLSFDLLGSAGFVGSVPGPAVSLHAIHLAASLGHAPVVRQLLGWASSLEPPHFGHAPHDLDHSADYAGVRTRLHTRTRSTCTTRTARGGPNSQHTSRCPSGLGGGICDVSGGLLGAGLTPLHFAAAAGHRAVVSALLLHGADKDAAAASAVGDGFSASGFTAMHFAASNGRTEVVRLLAGAR